MPIAVVACLGVLATTGCASSTATDTHSLDVSALDSETRAYLESNASSLAQQLGIADPPIATPIRLIGLDEWASTQKACLEEAGYDIQETRDGQGIIYPTFDEPSLSASLNLAIYTCEVRYPTDLKYVAPLATDQLEDLYNYRTTELIDCLENEGYAVSANPPSQTVFIQSEGNWSPYDGISLSSADVKRVYQTCPQTPESIYER